MKLSYLCLGTMSLETRRNRRSLIGAEGGSGRGESLVGACGSWPKVLPESLETIASLRAQHQRRSALQRTTMGMIFCCTSIFDLVYSLPQ